LTLSNGQESNFQRAKMLRIPRCLQRGMNSNRHKSDNVALD
jgi:hypothetical protein